MYETVKDFATAWLQIYDHNDIKHTMQEEVGLCKSMGKLPELREFMHTVQGTGLIALLKNDSRTQRDFSFWALYIGKRTTYLIDMQEQKNKSRIAEMRAGNPSAEALKHHEVPGVVEMVRLRGNPRVYLG